MTSTKILFIAFLTMLFAGCEGCRRSPTIQFEKALSNKKWELQDLEIIYSYEIEESYIEKPGTDFRYVDQAGSVSLRYYLLEGEGVWTANTYYSREQETEIGTLPIETFNETDTHTGITGIWEFVRGLDGSPAELSQEYFEIKTGCNLPFDFEGNWDIRDPKDLDRPTPAVIDFEIAHLTAESFAGDLVFYPVIFDTAGYFSVYGEAEIENISGQEVLEIKSAYEADDYELRSKSFEDDDYGSVEVEEKLRTIYINAKFERVEDDPC